MSDLLDMIQRHVSSLGWIEHFAYVIDRGWEGIDEHPRDWISPHDGERYTGEEAMMIEIILELSGNPTPRLGKVIDTRKMEAWVELPDGTAVIQVVHQ